MGDHCGARFCGEKQQMPEANVVRVGLDRFRKRTDFVLGKLGLIGYDSLAIFPIRDMVALIVIG